ncbi:MAG: TVP38/TMEM64 family protein [bacterium]
MAGLTREKVVSTLVSVILLLAIIVIFGISSRYYVKYFRNPEELRVLVKSWGIWAPMGVMVLQLIQIVVAPLPGNVMSFASGYALGFWPMIVWLILGVLGGATVAFTIAKLSGRRLLRLFVPSEALAKFDALVLRRGIFYIFLLLLVPNPLGDWVYYLAGLTGIRYPIFLLLVLIARLPSNVIECGLGSKAINFGLREWLILAVVVVLFTVGYIFKQHRIEKWLARIAGGGDNLTSKS